MKRPKTVTLLAVGVLILAGYFLLRTIEAAGEWEFLIEFFPDSYLPHYLAVSGLAWGSAGIVLGWGLMRGRRWAPGMFRILAVAFAAYWWLDSLLLAVDPAVRAAGIFRLAVTILLLSLIFWILATPGVKKYFGELNE